MKAFKTIVAGLLAACCIAGCGTSNEPAKQTATSQESKKLKIVATIFPPYDFTKEIVQDKADVTMLLKPGAESHSYEPTPQDIKTIQESDLFLYVGGENDVWVDKILSSMKDHKPETLKLVDCVDLLEEEHKEGMQAEEEEEEKDGEQCDDKEMDEHVWTSLRNVESIVKKIDEKVSALDPTNASFYQANTDAYIKKLQDVDQQFKDVVKDAKRKTIVFGDRFPFRYFVEDYGLDYYAAFPGCASDTEVNPQTLKYLINKVQEEKIPVVFTIELSNHKIADSICEATGAKQMEFHSCHNISQEDFDAHKSYITIMQENVGKLKEALQ